MGVGVAVKTQEVYRGGVFLGYGRGQGGTIRVFVRIQEDVGSIVFVVTGIVSESFFV